MRERFWPVHAIDVGKALEVMLEDDNTASQIYELYGPTNYSLAEIATLVDREILKKRRHINVPKIVAKPVAEVLNRLLWWHTNSADEIEREFIDQEIDQSAKTFKDLGIEPAELKGLTFHYLVSPTTSKENRGPVISIWLILLQQDYRSSSFFDLPPATEREKREEKKYLHVIDDQ